MSLLSMTVKYDSSSGYLNFSNVTHSDDLYAMRLIYCGDVNDSSRDSYDYLRSTDVNTSLYSKVVSWPTRMSVNFKPHYRDFVAVAIAIGANSGNTYVMPIASGIGSGTNFLLYSNGSFIKANGSNYYQYEIPDNIISTSGLSELVTSGNIKAAVYNGKSYPPGATIPLDPSVENISLVNQNYTLTMNDAQNMKNVQIDSNVYSDFPTTINVEKNTVLQMSGKDDPVITVDYTNTKKPTITNT